VLVELLQGSVETPVERGEEPLIGKVGGCKQEVATMQPFEFLAAPPAAAASLTSQQQQQQYQLQQLASNNNDSLPETESSYKAFPEDAENGNNKRESLSLESGPDQEFF
jgi:hypothetical protein